MTGHVRGADLTLAQLHGSLQDPVLQAMNFLNEVSGRHPDAVSFAAGRPTEDFFDVDAIPEYLARFCRHLESDKGLSPAEVTRTLFQYGRTKGIIHELLAENLRQDEGIVVDPESIVVTVGCQEAMFLCLRLLCADPDDVLLAVTPSYMGLTGVARLLDIDVWPVPGTNGATVVSHLAAQTAAVRAAGKRPRAFYIVPDFANPSGDSLDLEARKELLAFAADNDLLLLEDNPYSLFQADDGDRVPTLKALDTERRVVYLGSLAKTCFPGARIGFVVADQTVSSDGTTTTLLADELSKVKSMLTVNTPPLAQAIAGGKLLTHGCSLVRANEAEIGVYRRNLRLLLAGLASRFPAAEASGVTWNTPSGGFFVVVDVPFEADEQALDHSARRHRVLWTPMRHFYADGGGARQLRLSLSALSPEEISVGLDRFRSLVLDLASSGGAGP